MMLCEKCKEKEATIHLTQVMDGAVKKVHLCEECAASSGFDVQGPSSITDILLGIGGGSVLPESGKKDRADRACPHCHMKLSDFKKTGRLGCPGCYEAFEDELVSLLKVMHRKEVHSGKVPSRESVRVRKSAEIASLERALEEAIEAEQFEEAARIRDRIRDCRRAVEKKKEKPDGHVED